MTGHKIDVVFVLVIHGGGVPADRGLGFEAKAGIIPYRQPFLVHYLEAIIYPDIPESALIAAAAVVCAVNLLLYVRLFSSGHSSVERSRTSARSTRSCE